MSSNSENHARLSKRQWLIGLSCQFSPRLGMEVLAALVGEDTHQFARLEAFLSLLPTADRKQVAIILDKGSSKIAGKTKKMDEFLWENIPFVDEKPGSSSQFMVAAQGWWQTPESAV